jgi:hypothetical protein
VKVVEVTGLALLQHSGTLWTFAYFKRPIAHQLHWAHPLKFKQISYNVLYPSLLTSLLTHTPSTSKVLLKSVLFVHLPENYIRRPYGIIIKYMNKLALWE